MLGAKTHPTSLVFPAKLVRVARPLNVKRRFAHYCFSFGPATHGIVAELKAGRGFEFGKFDARPDAERYLEKLEKMI
jgi:hypothetical protein